MNSYKAFSCPNVENSIGFIYFSNFNCISNQHFINSKMYEGENETYIEASVENSSSILYDKEIRNKPRTRRTKRNV